MMTINWCLLQVIIVSHILQCSLVLYGAQFPVIADTNAFWQQTLKAMRQSWAHFPNTQNWPFLWCIGSLSVSLSRLLSLHSRENLSLVVELCDLRLSCYCCPRNSSQEVESVCVSRFWLASNHDCTDDRLISGQRKYEALLIVLLLLIVIASPSNLIVVRSARSDAVVTPRSLHWICPIAPATCSKQSPLHSLATGCSRQAKRANQL